MPLKSINQSIDYLTNKLDYKLKRCKNWSLNLGSDALVRSLEMDDHLGILDIVSNLVLVCLTKEQKLSN